MEQISGTQEQITAGVVASAATAAAKVVMEAAQAAAVVIAKENATSATTIAVLENKISTLQGQQTIFESEVNRRMDKLDATIDKIFTKLDEIAKGRPSWAVTVIITLLSTLCGSLIVYSVLR